LRGGDALCIFGLLRLGQGGEFGGGFDLFVGEFLVLVDDRLLFPGEIFVCVGHAARCVAALNEDARQFGDLLQREGNHGQAKRPTEQAGGSAKRRYRSLRKHAGGGHLLDGVGIGHHFSGHPQFGKKLQRAGHAINHACHVPPQADD